MSRDVALEIRPSRLQHAGWLGAFVLLMLGSGVFSEHTDWPLHLGLTGLMILLTLPAFFDTAPRLVIADEGLSWRKDRKDSLSFLSWSEILAADFKGGGEDDPRCLRLKLDRPSALERVASDCKDGWAIAIPIERLELPERQIMGAIRRRAPHLFQRKAA